ncbi:MAG: peptide chain release factor N(5)-glutamine methyltransferase [Gammaproteobacteria bacterium]|nr:peptide chain release factor N(5)-glutamine methyltransferase [Gammaproteobacteria bacterium]
MAKPSATTPLIMSKPLMTIASALQQGYRQLRSSNSDSAKLDSEILLLKVLNAHSDIYRTKTWLLTWPETTLTAEQFQQFIHYLKLRSEGMPVAYITGEKDFWTLTLAVTPATLIPRPETELLVEYALEKISPTENATLLELGTGSGAIALAIAAERSNVAILATDISQQALAVAQHNLERLKFSNVTFFRSDWFDAIPRQQFELIVSNPPYIAEQDPHLQDNVRKYEPLTALHAGNEGLDDIAHIIRQCRNYLKPAGWLLLEHGCDQAQAVQTLLRQHAFRQITSIKDLNQLPRISLARKES